MRKTVLLVVFLLISAQAFTISPRSMQDIPSKLVQAIQKGNESAVPSLVAEAGKGANKTPVPTKALEKIVRKGGLNRTRKRKIPKVIVPPKVKKFIEENDERIKSSDPKIRQEIRKEIKKVVKRAKLSFAIEIYKNCSDWGIEGVDVLKRVETKNHLFLLVNASPEILPQLVQDPCLVRLADKDGLKVFLRQVKAELTKERREKVRKLRLKRKRGLLNYTAVMQKVEEEAPPTPPPSTEGYNITSPERISYQNYITPDDPVIQENKKPTPEENYLFALSWVWISDPDLNGEPEKWLSPHEFLASTASMSSNPTRRIASDCSEQANTLVSLLRASGVSANDVKVVLGLVNFDGSVGGHAWVELKQEDGSWMPLESTSGPGYIDGEFVESSGVPFDYWKTHEYPVIERWVEYNDIFFVDYKTGKTNAPSDWPTKMLAGPDTSLSFPGEIPTAELDQSLTTDLYCKYSTQRVHAERTRIAMEAVLFYLSEQGVTKPALNNYLNSFNSEMGKAQKNAEANDEQLYEQAINSAKNFAAAFKTELRRVIEEKGLDADEIRAAVNSSLDSQQARLRELRVSRFRHCKIAALKRFAQYLEGLREDADTFAELNCGIQDLDPVVETVSTYEAYLENYMETGHEEGIEDIEEQITSLQEQLRNAAQICRRNRLALAHSKLVEIANKLAQKGVDVTQIINELNRAAQLINANELEEGAERLNSARQVIVQIAGGRRG